MAMTIRTIKYYFKEGLKSVFKNRVMSIASISTVAASLFIFGIFTMIVANVNNVVHVVQNQIEIEAFVKDGVSSSDQIKLQNDIGKISNVKEIRYKSKEDALKDYVKMLGDDKDMAAGLEERNPLPTSFVVKVDKPENVIAVAQTIRQMNGILKVNDAKTIVEGIVRVTKFIKIASIILMSILGIIAIFLISNTIKIAVFARKREIGIMRYIGATDNFIKGPFIIEGITLGLLGSIFASIILYFGYYYLITHVNFKFMMFNVVPVDTIMNELSWQFVAVGMFIGGIGSIVSLRKFLVM